MTASVRAFEVGTAEVASTNDGFLLSTESSTAFEMITGGFYKRTERTETKITLTPHKDNGAGDPVQIEIASITYTHVPTEPVLLTSQTHIDQDAGLTRPALTPDGIASGFAPFPNLKILDWNGDAGHAVLYSFLCETDCIMQAELSSVGSVIQWRHFSIHCTCYPWRCTCMQLLICN